MVDVICRTWLDTPEIPDELSRKFEKPEAGENALLPDVEENFKFWSKLNRRKRKRENFSAQFLPPNLEVSEQGIIY